jgi:hypothetical protein
MGNPDSPHFPKWRSERSFMRGSTVMPQSAVDLSFRHDVMSRWRRRHSCVLRRPREGTAVPPYLLDVGMFGELTSEECAVPLVHLVYHAVPNRDVARRVFHEGFSVLAKTDAGYFGQGIYFSHDLKVTAGCSLVLVLLLSSAPVWSWAWAWAWSFLALVSR